MTSLYWVSLLYLIYRKYRTLTVMQGILKAAPHNSGSHCLSRLSILILALWGEGGIALASTDILPAPSLLQPWVC